MRIENDIKLDFKDVLIRPKRSTLDSRRDVQLMREFRFKHAADEQYYGIPIIVSNMDHTGTIAMAEAVKEFNLGAALHKFHTRGEVAVYFSNDEGARNLDTWFTIGADIEKELTGLTFLPDKICIDVANGYTEKFVRAVTYARNMFPHTVIMAGNVVTPEMTEELILAGADIVKVGIGPGSVCTTRKVTGVGYPQLSAIIECADAAHGLGGLICADGGIQVPGDLGKAFGAGADFVMIGGLFAGHDECRGEVICGDKELRKDIVVRPYDHEHTVTYGFEHPDGTQIVTNDPNTLPAKYFSFNTQNAKMRFHGMSSTEAMLEHYGKVDEYRAAEGKEVLVPYKGSVKKTVEELLGGLRSTCTYVGARSLKELPKRTTCIKVSRQLNDMFS